MLKIGALWTSKKEGNRNLSGKTETVVPLVVPSGARVVCVHIPADKRVKNGPVFNLFLAPEDGPQEVADRNAEEISY